MSAVCCPACSLADYEQKVRADESRGRRERIATAVLQGMATADRTLWDAHGPVMGQHAERAVQWADALIEELDKE